MKKALLSDIDGTISDRSHRLHHLEGKKDWKSFFSEMNDDSPIDSTITHIESLLTQYDKLIFLTGRPEQYRDITDEWLQLNTNFCGYDLIMRGNKDYRKDCFVKMEMLNLIKKDFKVDTIFEDQTKLANMWEEQSLICHLIKVT